MLERLDPKLTANLPQLVRSLSSTKEIPDFLATLKTFLEPIMANFNQNLQEIILHQQPAKCPAAESLSSILGISLIAKRRPSMYVDCFHNLTAQNNELAITTKLNQLGLFATLKVVDNHKQLIIPCVNSPEVVKILQRKNTDSP